MEDSFTIYSALTLLEKTMQPNETLRPNVYVSTKRCRVLSLDRAVYSIFSMRAIVLQQLSYCIIKQAQFESCQRNGIEQSIASHY